MSVLAVVVALIGHAEMGERIARRRGAILIDRAGAAERARRARSAAQSMSLSFPSSAPSLQPGVTQLKSSTLHTPPAQSPSCAQPACSAHGAHEPPQSTSVSSPSRC